MKMSGFPLITHYSLSAYSPGIVGALLAAPAAGRLVVLGAGRDPALALRRLLALPERRVSLQPIDQEMAGGQRRLAMRRSGRHQDDAVAGFKPAIAVGDQRRRRWPAAGCLRRRTPAHL